MSLRKIPFVENEFYHLFNRGNDKRTIFHDKEDYQRFIKLLYLANSTKNFVIRNIRKDLFDSDREQTLVSIGSYCLMPNHFHLLVTQNQNGNISKFMQKLTTGYSMYYNTKYQRTGSLFEGKFKSEHVSSDNYLKYLFSYIHLNPVKLIDKNWKENGIKDKRKTLDFLGRFKFSSYLDYLEVLRPERQIINQEPFPQYFPKAKSFQLEILDWINYSS